MDSDVIERVSKRDVSEQNGRPSLTLTADLAQLELASGDRVKVVTYSDRIEIRPTTE